MLFRMPHSAWKWEMGPNAGDFIVGAFFLRMIRGNLPAWRRRRRRRRA